MEGPRESPHKVAIISFLEQSIPLAWLKPLSIVGEYLLPKTKCREAAESEEKDQAGGIGGNGGKGRILQGWHVETSPVNGKAYAGGQSAGSRVNGCRVSHNVTSCPRLVTGRKRSHSFMSGLQERGAFPDWGSGLCQGITETSDVCL